MAIGELVAETCICVGGDVSCETDLFFITVDNCDVLFAILVACSVG
jgi:hypothetical protein